MVNKREICVWVKDKLIPVTFVNLPDATYDEAKNYIDYVAARIKKPLDSLTVELCDDGKVDVTYTARGEKFERIRRITGE
jgi:hypothetical protein